MTDLNAVKLSARNLYEWVERGELYGVHDDLQKLWHVNTPFPEIIVYDGTPTKFDTPNKIFLSVKDTLLERRILRQLGYNIPIEFIIKTSYAEEGTHYISHNQVPENNKKEAELFYNAWFKTGYEDFLKAASIGSQNEGIANIGKRKIAENLGLENSSEMDKESARVLFKRNNEIFKRNVFGEPMGYISSEVGRGGENAKKARETFLNYIMDCYTFTVAGTGTFIADELERKYSGRLPQLIRKSLEPEKKYSDCYLGFIQTHMPSFKEFLDCLKS